MLARLASGGTPRLCAQTLLARQPGPGVAGNFGESTGWSLPPHAAWNTATARTKNGGPESWCGCQSPDASTKTKRDASGLLRFRPRSAGRRCSSGAAPSPFCLAARLAFRASIRSMICARAGCACAATISWPAIHAELPISREVTADLMPEDSPPYGDHPRCPHCGDRYLNRMRCAHSLRLVGCRATSGWSQDLGSAR